MGRVGIFEAIVILAVVLLLFGGIKKLPEIARAIGEALREFRKAGRDDDAS